jgi:hypothetical protein
MANTRDVLSLLIELGEKTGQPHDHAGFGRMAELIDSDNISQRYLYDLYKKVNDLHTNGIETTRVRQLYLDDIAKYLGYTGFLQFSVHTHKKISDGLQNCAGNWWSFVRADTGEKLYKAPVRIFRDAENNTMRMELKGRERVFFGEIIEKAGCLFIYLVSGAEKQLGLVFKIGVTKTINLLQGTFSGMSSAGYPIAGREVLIRETFFDYQSMEWSEVDIQCNELDQRLKAFFSEIKENCIAVKNITGFELNNL